MDFMQRIARIESGHPVVLDGAMGTQLAVRGANGGGPNCLSCPDVVLDVHRAYIDAGSDAIITNTFSMNLLYMASHGIAAPVAELNAAGVRIARSAAAAAPEGRTVHVLGDIGPTGGMLEPFGTLTVDEVEDAFREQAASLAAEGVDAFIIETFYDLQEALCAVRACRRVDANIPIIASMIYTTASEGGRTMMGNSAADCARLLSVAGASVIGTNCGDLDPATVALIVAEYRNVVSLPLMVEPNAGLPTLVDGKTVFTMTVDDFVQGVIGCRKAGAGLLGGCCGTDPAFIAAIRRAFPA
jgi:5-methyltetrahydrofolate--homocysteine methyltransferase